MENKKITINFPTIPVSEILKGLQVSYSNLKQKLQKLGIMFAETRTAIADKTSKSRKIFLNTMESTNRGFKRNRKKLLMSIIPLLIIGIFIWTGFAIFKTVTSQEVQGTSSTEKVKVADALKKVELKKTFTFPLLDNEGEEIGAFSYELQNAELRNEIIVQGQRATSVSGRIFVVINLKLKNDLKNGLEINSRDYIRLSTNGNKDDLLAPEIHNDPVEVQAISSKYTRVGFAINETDKNLVLIVGEIDGDKEEISLNF